MPDALEKCVRAVSRAIRNPSIGNIKERANIVYTSLVRTGSSPCANTRYIYAIQDSLTSLPDSLCERIGSLAFIPRQGDDLSPTWRRQYLPRMNSVVSPSQLALQGLDRIVWTQRALFEMEPPITLRNRWPSLGRPSIGEVVQHLVALAIKISPHVQYIYAHNNAFIQDLRETYDYLRDHVEDSEDVRIALSDHFFTPMFLNVEHPKQQWTWTSAENLVLDIDVSNSGVTVCLRS